MSDDLATGTVAVPSVPVAQGWADFGGLAVCIAIGKVIANTQSLMLGLGLGLDLVGLATVILAIFGGLLPAIYCRFDPRRLQIALFFTIISPVIAYYSGVAVQGMMRSMANAGYSVVMIGIFMPLISLVKIELVALSQFGALVALRITRFNATTMAILGFWLLVNALILLMSQSIMATLLAASALTATVTLTSVLGFFVGLPACLMMGYVLSCLIRVDQRV